MTAMTRPTGHDGRRGIVSVAALVVVLLLAVILLEFSHRSQVNLHVADNRYRSQQALCCAEAGVSAAIAALAQQEDEGPDGPLADLLSGSVRIPVGEGRCTVSARQENGKINVNGLKTSDGEIVRPRMEQLLRLIDLLNAESGEHAPIGYGMVLAMMDWTDADDEVTSVPFIKRQNQGAENDYYRSLVPPYRCKNAPFDVLEELLLVKGMTRGIFLGQVADAELGTKSLPGMSGFLTVYGDGKINVNYAPARVLEALSEGMDGPLAESIVLHRADRPFKSVEELRSVPGMTEDLYASLRDQVTVRPKDQYFRVTSRGAAGGIERTVNVILRKRHGRQVVHLVLREET